ncbi:MAG TPA: hypothetical protein VFX50_06870 [Gemmatimonadales bacterium]|nr:hypothetical protein [Gemmatimonadales bacterium]
MTSVTPNPAVASATTATSLIPLTVPEVRRLLVRLVWPSPPHADAVLAWSHWRRHHQAVARHCHYRHRARIQREVRL